MTAYGPRLKFVEIICAHIENYTSTFLFNGHKKWFIMFKNVHNFQLS